MSKVAYTPGELKQDIQKEIDLILDEVNRICEEHQVELIERSNEGVRNERD